MSVKVQKKPSQFRNLFFIRRRPVLRGISTDWGRPDEATYQQMLEWDGFVSPKIWEQHDPAKHPVIAQDMRDLDQHLLPTFYQFSQRAKYYQNRYYLYQWVFILGAFLTTLFGTLTTYVYNPFTAAAEQSALTAQSAPVAQPDIAATDETGDGEVTLQDAPFTAQAGGGNTWTRVFGYLTALVGAVTAFFTALSNRGEPQKRWAKNRRLTEELRMHYFKYLSHLPPYDGTDRVQKLREMVIDARIKEQENVS